MLAILLAGAMIFSIAPRAMAQEELEDTQDTTAKDTDGAEKTPGQPKEEGKEEDQPRDPLPCGGGDNTFIFVMLGGIVLLYIFMGSSRRKQEAKRKQMLSELKKGDKVTTIGGIKGTVIEVREDEVTVKVDENNNIRMRFSRGAISRIGDTPPSEQPK
jgi:preprotein translocase subunit YajC